MRANSENSAVIERLYQVIESRRIERPKGSHTAKLFRKGTGKIAQKVGEEAVETVIAAMPTKEFPSPLEGEEFPYSAGTLR